MFRRGCIIDLFKDDEKIINILHSEDTFKVLVIDDEQHEALLQASGSEEKPEHSNEMSKNSVRLEKFFNLRDKFRRPTNTKTNNPSLLYEVVNISIKRNPKNINLGKNCTRSKRATFIKLFRKFKDVFAWTYEDMITYDKKIIQHIIPLKEDVEPFQHKL